MISKAKIKFLQSLRQNKFRKEYNVFLAEGNINVCDFLKGSLTVKEVYGTSEWIGKNKGLLKNTSFEEVSSAELERITALKNPSEVVALIEKPAYTLPDLTQLQNYLLALDDLRDPGNLGTIIRTADWFGIQDIVCSGETVDAFNPKVVQATMGSLARVRVHYTSLEEYFGRKPADLKIYGATLSGVPFETVSKPGKGILLIGSEAHGISQTLYPFIDEQIRIPSAPNSGAESLNAAVATALVCYEFTRD
ncbi:MAG: RNA methyltransferase [Bacteroidales bacterium]|nr:RNA methyltransferase [Bacteroidales bacterium]